MTIHTPRCPGCDSEPMDFGAGSLGNALTSQCFCPNDDCHVLVWNPMLTVEQNAADMQQVELPRFDDGSEH